MCSSVSTFLAVSLDTQLKMFLAWVLLSSTNSSSFSLPFFWNMNFFFLEVVLIFCLDSVNFLLLFIILTVSLSIKLSVSGIFRFAVFWVISTGPSPGTVSIRKSKDVMFVGGGSFILSSSSPHPSSLGNLVFFLLPSPGTPSPFLFISFLLSSISNI